MPSPWRHCILLCLLTFVVYLPGLSTGFVWDDRWLITSNAVFLNSELKQLVGEALFAQTSMPTAIDYFRPVQAWSFWLDRTLFGTHPFFWHLHSIVLHLINVVLLYTLLSRLMPSVPVDPLRLRVLGGAAFFALHPLQSEPILWISARNELLYSGFVLGALQLLVPQGAPVRRGAEWVRLGVGLLCFALALFSKETAILFPLLLLGLERALGHSPDKKRVVRYGLLLLLLIGVMTGRAWTGLLVETDSQKGLSAVLRIPWLGFFLALPRLLGTWCTLVVLPYPLMVTRSLALSPDSLLVPAWLGLGLLPALGWLARRQQDQALRRLGLAAALSALVLLIPPLMAIAETGLIGERYLYLPLAFLGMALAALLPSVGTVRVFSAVGGITAVLLLQLRLPEWQSDVTLFAADHAKSPSCLSAAQLGGAYLDAGYAREALDVLAPEWTGSPACPQARGVARLAHERLESLVP